MRARPAAASGPVSRWQSVLATIRAAEREAGRDPEGVSLVAVSKGVTAETIETLLAAGHRTFAENRVQEMQVKWPPLLERHQAAELRFIGRLQSNKVMAVAGLAHVIESVDRESVARALSKCSAVRDRSVRLLVQVNVGEESQKGGCPPTEADRFIAWCQAELGLRVSGVMGIPPRNTDPVPYFGLLRTLRDRMGLAELSMGMSADYEAAIQMGATHVRVGTAVFGPRSQRLVKGRPSVPRER